VSQVWASFTWLVIGWFCCAYGVALYVFQRRERPKSSEKTRLSPNFVSAGSPHVNPVVTSHGPASAAE
jgi:hypothetical protein